MIAAPVCRDVLGAEDPQPVPDAHERADDQPHDEVERARDALLAGEPMGFLERHRGGEASRRGRSTVARKRSGVARRTSSRGSGTSSTRSPPSRARPRRRGSSSTVAQRAPVAAQHERLEVGLVRQQHARRDVGRGLHRHARLALAPAREALLALAAGLVAPVDVAPPDLGVDQPPAGEHAGRVAAEADEQHADHALARDVVEQRAGAKPSCWTARAVRTAGRPRAGRRRRRGRRRARGRPRSRTTGACASAQRSSQRPSRSGGTS